MFPLSKSRNSVEGQAALAYVVSLDEITGKDLAGSDSAVVRTLGGGEPTLGPTVRLTVRVEQGVLLLETEPGLVLSGATKVDCQPRPRVSYQR